MDAADFQVSRKNRQHLHWGCNCSPAALLELVTFPPTGFLKIQEASSARGYAEHRLPASHRPGLPLRLQHPERSGRKGTSPSLRQQADVLAAGPAPCTCAVSTGFRTNYGRNHKVTGAQTREVTASYGFIQFPEQNTQGSASNGPHREPRPLGGWGTGAGLRRLCIWEIFEHLPCAHPWESHRP